MYTHLIQELWNKYSYSMVLFSLDGSRYVNFIYESYNRYMYSMPLFISVGTLQMAIEPLALSTVSTVG